MKSPLTCLLIAITLSVSGCGIHGMQNSSIPRGSPISPHEEYKVAQLLIDKDEEIKSFRGLYRSSFEHEKESWQARQAVVFQKPDKLRIEALPLVGVATISLLVARQGVATYLDVPNKKAYQGSAESDFFNQFLKVSASERELMSLFVGRIPARYLNAVQIRSIGDSYSVTRGGYVWKINKSTLLCSYAEVRDAFNERIIFSIEYGSPMQINKSSVSVPNSIKIVSHRDSSTALGELVSGEINLSINSTLFEQKIPIDFSKRG